MHERQDARILGQGTLSTRQAPQSFLGSSAQRQDQPEGSQGTHEREIVFHPKIDADLSRLPKKAVDTFHQRVEELRRGERHSSTHPLNGPLRGWEATSIGGNQHRMVHRLDGGDLMVLSAGNHDQSYDQAMRRGAMGMAGPDYDNLTFHHMKYPNGNEEITAHHPEHGIVGSLRYQDLTHEPWTGYPARAIHVDMLGTHHEHKRRGVATQMMNHLENRYPDVPIDHGERTYQGEQWGRDKYERTSKPIGGSNKWDPESVHYDADWTLNGEPHSIKTNKPLKRNRQKVTSAFTPKLRVFTATCGLDHRLWDADEKLKPDARKYVLHSIAVIWSDLYKDWSKWSRIYFAGSEASEWTSPTLEGNGDFDILVGVDYDGFRDANPQYKGVDNRSITDEMNEGFRQYNGQTMIMIDGVNTGPWDRTTYVNQDSYDIRKIRPYAAYDVGKNEWVVKPPHLPHWSLSELPSPVQKVLRATDTLARNVLKLSEPERTQQGAALFDAWHTDRSRAFSPNGEGWYDIANLREKWLDQAGLWAEIVNCKHRFNEGLGAAPADWSNTPMGYVAVFTGQEDRCPCGEMAKFDRMDGWQHLDGSITCNDGGTCGEKMSCSACGGTGEQVTGHECYQCDASGLSKYQDPTVDNANPENGLFVGQDIGRGIKPVTALLSPEKSNALDEIGRQEHPNVDHYRSGGIGHREGDESQSVVGFMPVKAMLPYRDHDGTRDGEDSERRINSLREDIHSGVGIKNPIIVHYSDKNKWGYIGEGNHRLEAARREGLQTIPVRVGRDHDLSHIKESGRGAPMDLRGKFDEDRRGGKYPYVPSDIHPHHFFHEAVKIEDYQHDPDHEWFHGSPNKFTEFKPVPSATGDWNTQLGTHFTSEHDVAKSFGKNLHTVRLDMQNPKVYPSEADMDRHAMTREHESGNHYSAYPNRQELPGAKGTERDAWMTEKALHAGDLERAQDYSHAWLSNHPDRKGIADRFVSHLRSEGHDGIVYGNDHESPGHASAIAFHPGQIRATSTLKTAMPWDNRGDVPRPRPKSVRRAGFASLVTDSHWHRDFRDNGKEADQPDHLDNHLAHFVREHSVHPHVWYGKDQDMDLTQPIHATQSHVSQFHVDRYRRNANATSWAMHDDPDPLEHDDYQGHYRPLMVTHEGRVHVIEGHHRVAAALQEGKSSMPVFHHDLDKEPIVRNPNSNAECPTCNHFKTTVKAPESNVEQRTAARVHDLYGKGLSGLFRGDEDGPPSAVPAPFPQARQSKVRKTFDSQLVGRSITHPHEFPDEDVDPRELHATQPSVTYGGVKHYVEDGKDYGKQNGNDHRLGNDIPRIYHRLDDDSKIILSGHHRAAAALLKGEPLRAKVIRGGWGDERSK